MIYNVCLIVNLNFIYPNSSIKHYTKISLLLIVVFFINSIIRSGFTFLVITLNIYDLQIFQEVNEVKSSKRSLWIFSTRIVMTVIITSHCVLFDGKQIDGSCDTTVFIHTYIFLTNLN